MIDLVLSKNKFSKNCQLVDLANKRHYLYLKVKDTISRLEEYTKNKNIMSYSYKDFNDDSFLEDSILVGQIFSTLIVLMDAA